MRKPCLVLMASICALGLFACHDDNPASHLTNGCLVAAEIEQAHLDLNEATLWNRVLVVGFNQAGATVSHAWCLYLPKNGGRLYAYDYRGSTPLSGDSTITPDQAAKQLIAFPEGAQFIDNP